MPHDVAAGGGNQDAIGAGAQYSPTTRPEGIRLLVNRPGARTFDLALSLFQIKLVPGQAGR